MNENNQQQHPVTPTHSWGVITEVESGFNGDQQHPDNQAVDRFAQAMKDKMAKQRVKGYGGWDDKADCPASRLQQMLVDHIPKGDPVDVANFAMMLWNRGERTVQPAQQQEPVAWFDKELNNVKWKDGLRNCDLADQQPLYTSPPASKPWVGLSTIELDEIDAPIRERGHATIAEIYQAIEAKLREKNT